MKLKNLLWFAAAGMFAFTSCNNDDSVAGGGNERENGDLILKIETSSLNPRAVTDDVNLQGVKTKFEDGAIFFVKGNGKIERYVTISNTVIGAITATELQNGVLFKDVDKEAKEVVVVGNYSNFVNHYENITDLNTLMTDLEEQYDGAGGIDKVTLFGRADITAVVSGSGTPADGIADYEAYPEIAPIASRFEIVKMTYTDLTGASDAEGEYIRLEGIYLNNIYYSMSITGSSYAGWFNHGTTIADYFRASEGGQYSDNWHPFVFDDNWDGTTRTYIEEFIPAGTPDVYALNAGTGKIWAYNFFPDPITTAHIVFHFSNVWIEDENAPGTNILRPNAAGAPAGECYLTARNYKLASDDSQITIQQANVYRITDLAFNTGDFDDTPEEKDKDFEVYVKVSVLPWTVNEVKVDW